MSGHNAKMLSYTPRNGLADQLRQLTLARALAERLQRKLIVPNLLSHFDADSKTSERAIASKVRGSKQRALSWLLDLSRLGVPVLDANQLPSAFEIPECSAHELIQGLQHRNESMLTDGIGEARYAHLACSGNQYHGGKMSSEDRFSPPGGANAGFARWHHLSRRPHTHY